MNSKRINLTQFNQKKIDMKVLCVIRYNKCKHFCILVIILLLCCEKISSLTTRSGIPFKSLSSITISYGKKHHLVKYRAGYTPNRQRKDSRRQQFNNRNDDNIDNFDRKYYQQQHQQASPSSMYNYRNSQSSSGFSMLPQNRRSKFMN